MTSFQNLIVTHSDSGLTAVYASQHGEQYTARFVAVDDLLKALADAGTVFVTDNRLVKKQLRARQDVVTAVHATTPERLQKAGFVKDQIAA
jgi:hypothetical protein